MSKAASTPRNWMLPTSSTLRYTIDADVIKCPLCADVFKSPRVLPCGHTACFTCLDSLILNSDTSKSKPFFPCPVCRRKTKPADPLVLRQRWATQYPINYVILRLLRNVSVENPENNSTHKAFCEICLANGKTRPVVAQCKNCEEHYCHICYKHHERREDARGHHMVYYVSKEEIEHAENRQTPIGESSNKHHRAVKLNSAEKHAIKLCGFNGKTLGDVTCDFRGGTFLTDGKVVLSDFANKKIKVFDVTHKSRVELICDLVLRVDPTQVCRVDANTVAVLTERSGSYHIKLFIIGENIRHFVHRSLDMTPLGIGYIRGTIVCSFVETSVLSKYRLSRAQQIQTGVIQHDMDGDDLFHRPGVICQGEVQGMPALYVTDEAENGVDVKSITLNGERRHSVVLVCDTRKPKVHSGRRSGRTSRSSKLGRIQSSRPIRKDDGLDSSVAPGKTGVEQVRQLSANSPLSRQGSREPNLGDSNGYPNPTDEALGSADRVSRGKYITTREGNHEAIERDMERPDKPVGKVVPRYTHTSVAPSSTESPKPNATSTIDTTGRCDPRELANCADSVAVDREGNVYVCLSGDNKVVRVSASGRRKTDLVTADDGLVAPRVVSLSPSNDVFFVACAGSNRVMVFKIK